MKIGVWVKEGIDFKRGGAFSYHSKLIQLIDDHKFSDELEIVFIASDNSFKSKKDIIQINDVFASEQSDSSSPSDFLDKIPIVSRFLKQKRKSIIRKQINEVKSTLMENNVDVIYYLTQAGRLVPDYPFISTNWDVGHLSTYAFPEFQDSISKANRIFWYNRGIHDALAVFVESDTGKEELVRYTNINPSRVMVIPMFPGDIINLSLSSDEQSDILNKHKLKKEKFFFYPAQFWAHKNHYNLVKAFKKISKNRPDIKLVFTGSDTGGNLNYIHDIIKKEDIKGISFLGFVDQEELFTFYKNSIALVMPSFLGPTNMPPLEALSLGCPVICSDLEGHKEQMKEAALYIDPLNQDSIQLALEELLKEDVRSKLILNGKDRLEVTRFQQIGAIKALEENLMTIRNYRNTWNH